MVRCVTIVNMTTLINLPPDVLTDVVGHFLLDDPFSHMALRATCRKLRHCLKKLPDPPQLWLTTSKALLVWALESCSHKQWRYPWYQIRRFEWEGGHDPVDSVFSDWLVMSHRDPVAFHGFHNGTPLYTTKAPTVSLYDTEKVFVKFKTLLASSGLGVWVVLVNYYSP